MNSLVIIGAGGHGKVLADNALKNGYTNICFVDDHATGECMGFPIVATSAGIERLKNENTDFIIGIGDNKIRKKIAEKYDVNWATLVHPSAQIASNVSIGVGTVIMGGVVINTCTAIGKHCIVNTSAVVEHDNIIKNYAHIGPGVKLGGTVHIGKHTHIGIGAVVKNNISICSDCIIGAGAVVVKDIQDNGTYVGIPTRRLR